ncbi:MAG: flagellar motor switch protein FliN [Thermoguttaceae bacterium]|jgi:flagellar motor switch protein FliN/FliY|nr:flagellar motor switch protein FliN [Thermoguttaceae bacterium]
MSDDNLMDQSEIERLLNQAKPDEGKAAKPAQSSNADAVNQALDQSEIEALLGKVGGKAGAAASSPQSAPAGDADKVLGQDDIEKLLGQAAKAPAATPQASAPAVAETSAPKSEPAAPKTTDWEGAVAQEDVDYLLERAERALQSIDSGGESDLPQGVAAFRLEEFPGAPASTEAATLDLIRDVELDLKIELGRTNMYLEDVLKLRKGSVVPLDKLAGDPVDVYVNERLVARGEVLVLNDSFCVRIAELIAGVGAGA